MDTSLESPVGELARLILRSQSIVVFTGAGISTESGIPDFRGPDGLWTKVDPEDFAYQRFVADPAVRKRVWRMQKSMGFGPELRPNAAHYAIVELDRLGRLDCVITQNVDGLHQKAGLAEDKVIQLHGNMSSVKCLSCSVRHSMEEVQAWVAAGEEDPPCRRCGGILKPEAVFFGEAMPVWETVEAERRARDCDLCIVIGSTLAVYPAGLMPVYALRGGAKLAIVNQGPTELDGAAHLRIEAAAGETMSRTLELVRADAS